MTEGRLLVFDVARALCAIHIVMFWHGVMYFYPDSVLIKIGSPITVSVLAFFTFLSGLFCSVSRAGTWAFYKSRIKRLYIPFVISYILLVLIGFNDFCVKNAFLSLTGLSVFFGGQPNTLWYVCMLLVFYLLSPLCIGLLNRSRLFYIPIVLTFGALVMIFPNMDMRVLYYFPFYVLGLLSTPHFVCDNIIWKNKKVLLFILGVIVFGLTALFSKYGNHESGMILILTNILYGLSGIVILLFISEKIAHINFTKTLFSKLAYSSMSAYLFHRVFFFLCIGLLTSYIGSIYILIIAGILTFVCSYLFQKGYDFIIKKI